MKLKTALGAALLAFAAQALAQYPNKPVHVVISFTPGSSTDIVGRIVAQKLSEMWGQPVVPENRGGAGGSIGTETAVRAAPDGYTAVLASTSEIAVNPVHALPVARTIEGLHRYRRSRSSRTCCGEHQPALKNSF
jgi:tripartite-type tricarboxylate transporter receptor subunit TctC